MKRIFIHAEELITNHGVVQKLGVRPIEDDLGILPDGALLWDDRTGIEWIGTTKGIPRKFLKSVKRIDLSGKILSPALVDCHTHLVFSGSRHNEFAMRLTGKTYQDIAAAGGGIVSSVKTTRASDETELFKLACKRVDFAKGLGIGIIEIKSGYGLDWPTERKILKVIQKLKKRYEKKIIIRATFLGAHAFPVEATTDVLKENYVQKIISEMLPKIVREKLADACDVFFDQGYFTEDQSRRILLQAKRLGLQIKLHADELADVGGAALAAELGVLSADHLLRANEDGLRRMAKTGVVAVLLPGTALYLGIPYARAKLLRELGLCVALATDFNPGSSPTQHLPLMMSLGCFAMEMTAAESFVAATYGGARALGLHRTQGYLEVGLKPKMAVFDCPSYKCLLAQIAHPGLCSELF